MDKKLIRWINKCKKIHGDLYDYSLVSFNTVQDKVTIICPIHGEFVQRAYSHSSGVGCRKCFNERVSDKFKYSFDEWISKFNCVHDNKYEYPEQEINSKNKIKIICPIHGEFYQLPAVHSSGHGCPKCGNVLTKNKQKKKIKNVIEDFKKIHNDKYSYEMVDYEGAKHKVKIICPHHGEFYQTPNDHLSGYGCPSCKSFKSKAENEIINYIKSLGVSNIIQTDRKLIYPKEIDIYLPDHKFAIEYNGMFWHSFDRKETKEEKYRHYNKTKSCIENGVFLFHIFEQNWILNKNIIKSIIKSKLGKCEKIYARKCSLEVISSKDFNNFCDRNHLQGKRYSTIKLGLKYNDEIVAIMGFAFHNKHQWELTRFCNKLNINVIGGASKLFKYFIQNYNPNEILSFCDISISDGSLYKILNMEFISISSPNYCYIKNGKVFSRYKCQKSKLKNLLLDDFVDSESESDNMFRNNYRRLWDCGNYKFVWRKNGI